MEVNFETKLFRYPGKGGWTFAEVPAEFAPSFRLSFGRTPVRAELNGKKWDTSVWTEKSGKILLPVPKNIRGFLGEGDKVRISIEYVFRFNPDSGDKIYKG